MKHMQSTKFKRAIAIIKILRMATKGMSLPAAQLVINAYGRDPYLVLVSCLLSLRTRDNVSWPASCRLFSYANNPADMLNLPILRIQELIYPCGFYRQKAETIQAVSRELLTRFDGIVPSTFQELVSLPGVGPKSANLVLAQGFNIPAICVDVHVHRISNRLGIVQTNTVEETEVALKALLPQEYWIEYNQLLVMWGQNICVPQSPWCSRCPVFDLCERRGVRRSR